MRTPRPDSPPSQPALHFCGPPALSTPSVPVLERHAAVQRVSASPRRLQEPERREERRTASAQLHKELQATAISVKFVQGKGVSPKTLR